MVQENATPQCLFSILFKLNTKSLVVRFNEVKTIKSPFCEAAVDGEYYKKCQMTSSGDGGLGCVARIEETLEWRKEGRLDI